jgi:hypothetical protein
MNKICHLHLGLHKTASSSFQETCARNRELLGSFGITYPIFNCLAASKSNQINHSTSIYSLFCKNPKDYHANIRWNLCGQIDAVNRSYNKQLEAFLERSTNLIISGEDISVLDKDALEKFVEKIKSYDYTVDIFALVRSPYNYLCSSLQQVIKGGRYRNLISLNDLLPTRKNVEIKQATRSTIVEKLKSTFHENIQFYSFENACKHKYGPVGFLIEKQLQIDPSLFVYSKVNESLFNLSVRVQNEQNKLKPEIINGKKNHDYVSLLHLNKSFSSSGKFLLTENEYNFIKDSLETENKKYLDLLGEDFVDKSIKFSKPIIRN